MNLVGLEELEESAYINIVLVAFVLFSLYLYDNHVLLDDFCAWCKYKTTIEITVEYSCTDDMVGLYLFATKYGSLNTGKTVLKFVIIDW